MDAIHFTEVEGEARFCENYISPSPFGNVSNVHQVISKLGNMSGPNYLLSALLSAQEHYQCLDQQQHNPVQEPFPPPLIESNVTFHSADKREHYAQGEVLTDIIMTS